MTACVYLRVLSCRRDRGKQNQRSNMSPYTYLLFAVLTDVLMQIEITGGSIANCSKQFSSFLDYDPRIQFCAGDVRKNVKDACQVSLVLYGALSVSIHSCSWWWEQAVRTIFQGDSGGPLIQRRDKDGRFEIVGITSFGVGCATGSATPSASC